MARPPGLIERRGQGWRVRIRIDGERYVYGPRSAPLLRHGTREEVEAWVWEEYRRLAKRAKRESAEAAGVITFSALVEQYKENELADLAPGSQRTYADTLKIAGLWFRDDLGDPPVDQIRKSNIKRYLAWRRRHSIRTIRQGDAVDIKVIEANVSATRSRATGAPFIGCSTSRSSTSTSIPTLSPPRRRRRPIRAIRRF